MIFNTFIRGAFIVVWLHFPFGSKFCEGKNLLADNIIFTRTSTARVSFLLFCATSCFWFPLKPFFLFNAQFLKTGCFLPNFWHDLRTRRQVNKMDAHARSVKIECFVTVLHIGGNFNLKTQGSQDRVE